MKRNQILLLTIPFTAILVAALPSCAESKGPGEKIGEAIDDATDSRPAEGIKDAAENVEDALKDATN